MNFKFENHTARQIQLHHIASLVSEDDKYISSSNRSGLVVKAVVIYERNLVLGISLTLRVGLSKNTDQQTFWPKTLMDTYFPLKN